MQLAVDQFWNDLEIGHSTGLSRGRTVTETDVVQFMMLTGNWVEIHSNVEFAKGTPFGQRLVQGSLVLAMSQGLFTTGRAVRVSVRLCVRASVWLRVSACQCICVPFCVLAPLSPSLCPWRMRASCGARGSWPGIGR